MNGIATNHIGCIHIAFMFADTAGCSEKSNKKYTNIPSIPNIAKSIVSVILLCFILLYSKIEIISTAISTPKAKILGVTISNIEVLFSDSRAANTSLGVVAICSTTPPLSIFAVNIY